MADYLDFLLTPRSTFDHDDKVGTRVIVSPSAAGVVIAVNGRSVELDVVTARRVGTALIDAADTAHRTGAGRSES